MRMRSLFSAPWRADATFDRFLHLYNIRNAQCKDVSRERPDCIVHFFVHFVGLDKKVIYNVVCLCTNMTNCEKN